METCPKCGSMLLPKKENDKKILLCPRCGHKKDGKSAVPLGDVVTKAKPVEIVDANQNDVQHPVTSHLCGSCGNGEAHWWIQQTRASDEAPTRFYKCTKCKSVVREY